MSTESTRLSPGEEYVGFAKKKKVKVLFHKEKSGDDSIKGEGNAISGYGGSYKSSSSAAIFETSRDSVISEVHGTPQGGDTVCDRTVFTSPDSGVSSADGLTPIKTTDHSAFSHVKHNRQSSSQEPIPAGTFQHGPSFPRPPSSASYCHVQPHIAYSLPPPMGIIPNYFLAHQISPFQYTSFINYGYSMYHRCLQDGIRTRPPGGAIANETTAPPHWKYSHHNSTLEGDDSVDGPISSGSSPETADDDDRDSPIIVDDDYSPLIYAKNKQPTPDDISSSSDSQRALAFESRLTSTPMRETPERLATKPKQLELTVATSMNETSKTSDSSENSESSASNSELQHAINLWQPLSDNERGVRQISAMPVGMFLPLVSNHHQTAPLTGSSAISQKPPQPKKYKCDVCDKAFSRSNTLVTHKRIHTGAKPFSCDQCGRAFRQPGNLTRHKMTHTSHKPYVCTVCAKAFNRASNLQTHMRTHTNYRPFVCPYCGKGFHQKIDMKIHCYTHTGEKPHKCGVCGKGFKQLTHLTYHMRTHSDKKPFHCPICDRGFNQKGNLQTHMATHNDSDGAMVNIPAVTASMGT